MRWFNDRLRLRRSELRNGTHCGAAAARQIHLTPTNPQSTLLLYSMFCLELTIFQWEYPTIADRYLCGRRRNRTSITLKTIGCFIVSLMPHFSVANRCGPPVAGAGISFIKDS